MRGLEGNLSDLTVASFHYDILSCSETLVSDMLQVSQLLVPGLGRQVLLCRDKIPRSDGWLHKYETVTVHFVNQSLSAAVAKCCFLGFVAKDRTCMCLVFTATLT